MNSQFIYTPFSEVFKWCQKSNIGSRQGKSDGKYKLYIASGKDFKYYDEYLEEGESLVFGTGGNPCIHYVTGRFAYTNHCEAAQKKRNDVCTKFYYYYFQKDSFAQLRSTFVGGGIKNSSKKKIGSLLVPVPPLPEQKRIVSRIEELFSQLDASVADLQAAKKRLKVYRQAVLKEAFEGIDAPIKRLEDLCYFITKGTTPPKTSITNSDTGIPFIKVYNLTFNNTLDFSIDPTFIDEDTHRGFLSRSITLPGDVLMNIVGPPMGKVSIVPDTYPEWNINQAIVRFRCLDDLDNKYLAYYLGYVGTVEKMKSKAKATAGQFNLTLEICRNLTIPVPSYSQQEEIVTEIESRLSVCDSIEQTVDTALQQAEALRQSILKQAFEGGL